VGEAISEKLTERVGNVLRIIGRSACQFSIHRVDDSEPQRGLGIFLGDQRVEVIPAGDIFYDDKRGLWDSMPV